MSSSNLIWILLLIIGNITVCHGSIEKATQLYDVLFSNYSSSIIPKCDASVAVQLKIGIALRQILDLNEPKQILQSNIWLRLSWVDCRLSWNATEYGISSLVLPYDRLWIPDITLYDNAENTLGGVDDYRPTVYPDGSVSYNFPSVISSLCKVDVTYFPFDKQTCRLKFGSWASHGLDLNITNTDIKMDIGAYQESGEWEILGQLTYGSWSMHGLDLNFTARDESADLSSYKESGEWETLDVPAVRHEIYYGCCPEPYPDVTFYIKLQRRAQFYLMNLLFPCMLMSSLAVLGFLLPPDSGEKVSLEITVLLSLSVFMLIVSETMPPTSETFPYIGMYFACAMVLVSWSCVMTVTVLNVHHRGGNGHKMPDWVRKVFLQWLAWILFVRSGNFRDTVPPGQTGITRRNSRVHAAMKSDEEMVVNEYPQCMQTADTNRNIFQNSKDIKTYDNNLRRHSSLADNIGVQEKEGMHILQQQLDCMAQLQQYLEKKISAENIVEEWQTLAKVLDRFFLVLFVLFQVISTVVIMGKISAKI